MTYNSDMGNQAEVKFTSSKRFIIMLSRYRRATSNDYCRYRFSHE